LTFDVVARAAPATDAKPVANPKPQQRAARKPKKGA
jgi:hypothetical protein